MSWKTFRTTCFQETSEEMGFELSDEKLNEAFDAFKKLADRKKEITDEDLFALFNRSTS